ncbi:MAG: sensor histidine kinase [Cypionkella sp.]
MPEVLKPVPSRFRTLDQASEATTLRTLNTFAVDLIAIPSVEELFWYVAQNVVGQLNFIDCVIYQSNDEQTELTQVAAWGEKNPFGRSILNPLVIPFGRGITGQVAQTQTAIIIDDLLKDQNYIPDTQPARSEICVPLVFRGRVVGVIDSEHPETEAFSEAHLEILSTVAAMTSAKLELLAETQRSNQRYHDLVVSHAKLTQETNNRKSLEAKLFEARKLEAVGRLTGRFAHEFNNLLTVISGNFELLEVDSTNPDSMKSLHDAQSAAARGAKLIRDMLMFAQRTRLEPSLADLNTLVTGFCEKSELAATTTVEFALANDLWLVSVDANALENALYNLVLNARDAMPAGGSLQITSENVNYTAPGNQTFVTELLPGRYARLSITDQGHGIPRERLSQIFDPFYTSKAVGAGTGLGLSMVLGFMQQSGGSVSVTSEVGQGTTFHLYLPIATISPNDFLTISR